MILFDTHFHYDGDNFTPGSYVSLIQETMAGLPPGTAVPEKILTAAVGGDYASSCHACRFAEQSAGSYFAAGVHPHEAESNTASMDSFRQLAEHIKCRAIGELGLDYYYETSRKKHQQETLAEFLALALEKRLPAILHCRDKDNVFDAYSDMYSMVRDFAAAGGRMAVHCFAGNEKWAEKFLSLGAYLGVTGMVTFAKAENIRNVLKIIPRRRLLLETDSPYLAPAPFRGKPNNPGFLPLVAARTALELGMTAAELAEITTANAVRFFGIAENGDI